MSAYYIEEDEDNPYNDYAGKVLLGPNDFMCVLGEPEDCSWYRDGGAAVVELNRLYERIEELIPCAIRNCLEYVSEFGDPFCLSHEKELFNFVHTLEKKNGPMHILED